MPVGVQYSSRFSKIAAVLLVVYLCVLFYLTMRSPAFSYAYGVRVNLIPFRYILFYLDRGGSAFIINVLGNLAVFMPYGFLLPLLSSRLNSFKWIMLCSMSTSMLIEVLQYMFARRVTDIDDVLLNTLGGVLGYLCYRLLERSWTRRMMVVAKR